MPKTPVIDLTGQRFGKRIVICRAEKKWGEKPFWRVRCDCGTEDDILGVALRKGLANQCRYCQRKALGESSVTHGQSRRGKRSLTYHSWCAMRDRCLCPTYHHYGSYGGRGIKICDRWSGTDGFENFLADMGSRPKGKTLDRYPDVNGNYEPTNCRWATPKEQVQNQRKHGLIEIFTDQELISELHRRGIPV